MNELFPVASRTCTVGTPTIVSANFNAPAALATCATCGVSRGDHETQQPGHTFVPRFVKLTMNIPEPDISDTTKRCRMGVQRQVAGVFQTIATVEHTGGPFVPNPMNPGAPRQMPGVRLSGDDVAGFTVRLGLQIENFSGGTWAPGTMQIGCQIET